MEALSSNWWWTLVIFPVIVTAFKNEIGGIWEDWRIYKNRLYDMDGKPDTADICQLCNPNTGTKFICVIEKYKFWPEFKTKWKVLPYFDCTRGLFISIINDNNTMDRKVVSFKDWRGMDHRQIEAEIPPIYRDKLVELGLVE